MSRLRTDNVFGTVTDAPLTAGATTLNSAGLANLAAVASPNYAVITLDPNRVNGAPEIIYVTAHTGSATSATILRAQEGTSARQHPSGTFWVHAPSAEDFALGEVAFASAVTNQTGISSEADLTSLSVTFTADVHRLYRVSATLLVQQLTSTGNALCKLTDGSNTEFQRIGQATGIVANAVIGWSAIRRLTGLSGSQTFKLRASTSAGTLTIVASSSIPATLLVEDIGPNRLVQPT